MHTADKEYISCESSNFSYKGSVLLLTTDSANHVQTKTIYLQKQKEAQLASISLSFPQSATISETKMWGWACLQTVRQSSLACLVQSEKEEKFK